ncbi:hypothetical protein [Puia dinghuensis]|uniref:Uncharacterized protein n=1 Tax=Puia dinghuensis TaxID=1792502 RepID=A0A8J2UJC4_9BACT|nr:hypothetical protein [Puia dinghuensis]GGB25053.1 hypothetical protein GCM10011511_56250 [Puia dinghuensis]
MTRKNSVVLSVIRYILYTILLMVIETIICIVCFEGELLIPPRRVDSWHLGNAVRDALQINMVRFMFYYAIYFVPFYLFMRLVKWKRRTLQAAVANCGLYVAISLVYSVLLPDTFDYFSSDFFYILVAATFLSPLLLGRKVAGF